MKTEKEKEEESVRRRRRGTEKELGRGIGASWRTSNDAEE